VPNEEEVKMASEAGVSIPKFASAGLRFTSVLPDRFHGTSDPRPGLSAVPEEFRSTTAVLAVLPAFRVVPKERPEETSDH